LYVRSRIFPNSNNVIEPIFFFPNPDYKKWDVTVKKFHAMYLMTFC
jgi:hypothetical protein